MRLTFKMKIVINFALLFVLFFQNTFCFLNSSTTAVTLPANNNTNNNLSGKNKPMKQFLTIFAESSNILCIECFKLDLTRMFICLSQPRLGNRIGFIRRRCPMPVNLYTKMITEHFSKQQRQANDSK